MSPEKTVRLREALREVARRRGRKLSELSVEIGRSPSYLAKALGTFSHLKVIELFQLLALLEIEPREFFYAFFPLGGERVRFARRSWEDRIPYELIERPSDARAAPLRTEPEEWAADLTQLLAGRIIGRKVPRQAVAQALGLTGQALTHALSGTTQLHLGHLVGALEVVGDSPERFFFELTAPASNLAQQIAWSAALDDLERHFPSEPRPKLS